MFHLQTLTASKGGVWEGLWNQSLSAMPYAKNVLCVCVQCSNLWCSRVSVSGKAQLWFFMNETSRTASSWVDLELHSLLPAMTNKEWPVQYVGQVMCVCVCVCSVVWCVTGSYFDSWSSFMKCNETKGIVRIPLFSQIQAVRPYYSS